MSRNFNLKNSVSVIKSQFQYLNRNFSFKILTSVIKLRFQYLNRNFSFQILISVMKSQFQPQNYTFKYWNLGFSIRTFILILSSLFYLDSEFQCHNWNFNMWNWNFSILINIQFLHNSHIFNVWILFKVNIKVSIRKLENQRDWEQKEKCV